MKVLLASMVLAYLAISTCIAAFLHRARSSSVDTPEGKKRFNKFKTAIALAVFAKFAVVIGFFIIFLFHYPTLRYWVAVICFLIGLEMLWTALSNVGWRPTVPASAKNVARQILVSSALLVAITVFLFFNTKLHLCLSLWDLGGVVFFFISNNVAIVLRFGKNRASGSGGAPPFGANLVPKQPDTP